VSLVSESVWEADSEPVEVEESVVDAVSLTEDVPSVWVCEFVEEPVEDSESGSLPEEVWVLVCVGHCEVDVEESVSCCAVSDPFSVSTVEDVSVSDASGGMIPGSAPQPTGSANKARQARVSRMVGLLGPTSHRR
jgi:hypothetical protein